MTDSLLLAATPLAGLVVNVLVHAAIGHLTRGRFYLAPIGAGFAAGLAADAVLTKIALGGHGGAGSGLAGFLALNLLAGAALGFGYFVFVNLNLTSLRIRILREVLAAPGGVLSREALARLYDEREILEARLKRLTTTGQLRLVDERYRIGRTSVLRIARLIGFLKWIILKRPL